MRKRTGQKRRQDILGDKQSKQLQFPQGRYQKQGSTNLGNRGEAGGKEVERGGGASMDGAKKGADSQAEGVRAEHQ
jgi:hypothetical protein